MSDPSSNHIISWSAEGRTFTVWQPDLLEVEHLPNTFKHSNFASFVRQLNNYGFRKCHSDRFEFGVEGFEQGKPELLTTLRRHDAPRSRKGGGGGAAGAGDEKNAAGKGKVGKGGGGQGGRKKEGTPTDGAHGASLELGAYGGITSEVEQLKRDRLLLLKEVMRLREVQSSTSDEVRRLSARLQATEQFQQQMMSFVEAVQQGGGGLSSFNGMGVGPFTGDEVAARASRGGFPRKRRQMLLSSTPHNNNEGVGGGGGGAPGGDVEMRVGAEPSFGGGTSVLGSLESGNFGGKLTGVTVPVVPGGGGGSGGGGERGGLAGGGAPLSLQEIDELMPSSSATLPKVTINSIGGGRRVGADDDALAQQQNYGPLSNNPSVPIQLPFGPSENEKDFAWMDLLTTPNSGSAAPVDIQQQQQQQSGFGQQSSQALGASTSGWHQPPAPAPVPSSLLIRSMSEDDPPGPENSDIKVPVAPVLDSSGVTASPGGAGDTFVSSILERGPSLEKQLSLGFLDSMNSAEIGEMVREMQIGGGGGATGHQLNQDEIARRVDALTNP